MLSVLDAYIPIVLMLGGGALLSIAGWSLRVLIQLSQQQASMADAMHRLEESSRGSWIEIGEINKRITAVIKRQDAAQARTEEVDDKVTRLEGREPHKQ